MSQGPLVVGIGNADRGDDAAGLLAVRRLRGLRIAGLSDCTDLFDLWAEEEDVIVIDAMVTGAPVGTVRRFEVGAFTLPVGAFPSTHSFGLAETVELARALGKIPAKLTIFGIEAGRVGLGEGLSPEVDRAIDALVEELQEVAA
jgi:hydrogenase maturation protease